MAVLLPTSLDEAYDFLDRFPSAQLLAGGTDFMVEVNAGQRRPDVVVCLGRVPEISGWRFDDGHVVLGAAITYTEMMGTEIATALPGLAQAGRTVGSPQIRNTGTIGGNLGTASPAGDTLPILAALGATIVVGARNYTRNVPLSEFVVGPKSTSLRPGEIIIEVRVPTGFATQEFLKVGTRNAMVIAVASVALVVDWTARRLHLALGSVGPVVIRAHEAEALAESIIDWDSRQLKPPAATFEDYCALVRAAARPIDDHRSTAEYRRHAVGICAERALRRALAGERSKEASWTN